MPRVLIVDDSPTARAVLTRILSSDPALEVIGFAENGKQAIDQVRDLRPDVITMDLNMPVMDGIEATREIMFDTPTPIVVVSATARAYEVETAIEAMRAGALNVLLKPAGPMSPDYQPLARDIVNTVKAMAGVVVIKRMRRAERAAHTVRSATSRPIAARSLEVIAIVASTGGPPAVASVLAALPADFPIPLLLVQHMAAGFVEGFARWLDRAVKVKVTVAQDGEPVCPANVYVAPSGRHLGMMANRRIRLSDQPALGGFRPAGTHLFTMVSQAFGGKAAGVILTGMGDDGVEGLRRLHQAGGLTIAQDEATSVVFGMPRAAIGAGIVDTVLPICEIGPYLVRISDHHRPRIRVED